MGGGSEHRESEKVCGSASLLEVDLTQCEVRLSLSKRWPSRVKTPEVEELLYHARDFSYLPLESERPGRASRSPLSSLLGIQNSEVPQTMSMWTPTSLLRKSWLYCILDLGLSRILLEYDLTDVS